MKFNSSSPIYEQLKIYFKQEIVAGRYKPDQELPSRRNLAQDMKINPNTVQRAFKELEEEGIIVTEANVPSRVTSSETIIENLKLSLLEEVFEDFYQRINALGLDESMTIQALQDYIHKQRGEQA